MKRRNATRNALFTSIVSLLLCVSMLVGTTFAWFTDSVVSGNNVIAAGNLDIALLNNGTPVKADTNLFDDVLWEPGVVDYENFTIKNEGNLALVYDFAINWGEYNTLEGRNLTEILKVAMIDGHVSGDRAAAIAAGEDAGWAALDSWSFKGEMTQQGETKDFALIIYWQPSDSDNNYNVQNGKETSDGKALYVNLGINLQATQKMYESDSFGKDYDSLASDWDGSVGEVPAEQEGVITITTGAELAAFAASVNGGNSYSGKTVKLGADIDLGNKAWTPIGACNSAAYFQGTFDGQGHTIYDLNVDKSTDGYQFSTAGLFGWVDAAAATIKNVNVDGATVKGSHWVGVIAGYMTGEISNCTVTNANVVGCKVNDDANGDKVGGLVGYMNSGAGKLDGNTVKNSIIAGYRDVAGLAGAVATTNTVTNNTVETVTVTYTKDCVGEIVSPKTAVTVDATNKATDVTILQGYFSAEDLQEAINAATGEAIFVLAADITGNVTVTQKEGVKITVDGNDHKFNGIMTVDGKSARYETAALTIKNVNFHGQVAGADAYIKLGVSGNTNTRYTNHVTVQDCTFAGTDKEVVAVKSYTGGDWNVTITGCTVDAGMHSLAQLKNVEKNLVVTGCKVYSKNGLNVNNGNNLTMSDCTFDVQGYAVRFGESANTTDESFAIENSTLKSACAEAGDAVVEFRKGAVNATLTLTNTTLEGTTLFKGNTGDTTITVDGQYWVSTAKQLAAVVANGATDIYLLDGEYNIEGCDGKTLTLTGSKNAVLKVMNEGEDGCDYGFGATGVGNITFNGLTIDTTANTGNYKGYAYMKGTFNDCNFVGAYSLNNANDFVFNRCIFDFKNGYFWTWAANSVTFDGCTFNGNSKTILAHGGASTVITINDCDFTATEKGYTGSGDNTAAVEIDPTGSNTYTINFTGENTITDSYAGWTRVKDGSTGHTITGLN